MMRPDDLKMTDRQSLNSCGLTMACDIPVGEVRVTDDELTLMQPTSIAFEVVVVMEPTVPVDAAAPEADVADVSSLLVPE